MRAAALAQPPTAASPSSPAAPVAQFNGNRIQMPQKFPASRMSGLTLGIDPRWSNSYGYEPVEVTVSTASPAKRDRTIRIHLHSGWTSTVGAEQTIELPGGSMSVTATISLPVFQAPTNSYMWWDVWVDGVKDKDLTADQQSSYGFTGRSTGIQSNLSFLAPGPTSAHRSLVATNATEFEVLSLELLKFPTKWIDYEGLDVVALSIGDLETLRTKKPQIFTAICRWVRAGGQLWVGDAGKELENLPQISKSLRLWDHVLPSSASMQSTEKLADSQPAAAAGKTADAQLAKTQDTSPGNAEAQKEVSISDDVPPPKIERGWRALRFRRGNPEGRVVTFFDSRLGTRRTTRDPEVISRLQQDPNFVVSEERFETVPGTTDRRSATDSSAWFVEQKMALGTVRAFRGPNEVAAFAQSPPTSNPNAVVNSDAPDQFSRPLAMGLRRTLRWDSRHGLAPDTGNVEFAKLLVPGVGLAPVTEFEVLISLFVIVIGPLNYWILRRYKRLHLLVLTVPLAAGVTTASLFAYAILADGFDTRVRAYSYTALDQRSGEVASWARLSYYAGLAPAEGLVLPADLVMYPIEPAWAGDERFAEERFTEWDGQNQRLTRGWLSSRTPTQYLSLRSRQTPHRLEVLDAGDKVRVKNDLNTNIKWLFVVTESGKAFSAENVAAGANAPLTAISRDDAIRFFTKLVAYDLPRAPEALAASDSELSAMQTRARYGMYGRWGSQYNNGRLSDNLAAVAIAELAGSSDQPALGLPPRSYVAITESGPEVETGIPYAKEEASFHLLEGIW